MKRRSVGRSSILVEDYFMNEASNIPEKEKQRVPWLWLALSIVLFGVFMAFRGDI